MFLRFGIAEWNCVTKDNIFMCARYFFFFRVYCLSRRKQFQRYVSQNPILGILYSLSIFETLYVFNLTLSHRQPKLKSREKANHEFMNASRVV